MNRKLFDKYYIYMNSLILAAYYKFFIPAHQNGNGIIGSTLFLIGAIATVVSPDAARLRIAVPPPVEDHRQAVDCLALAIAYEAGNEPIKGQEAVAEVVLNRVRAPSFPKSVCTVVFAGSSRRTGCQFSFTCDGSIRHRLPERMMAAARGVAERAMEGRLSSHVGGATHYHAEYITPYWARTLVRLTRIGAHIFYRGIIGPGAVAPPATTAAEGYEGDAPLSAASGNAGTNMAVVPGADMATRPVFAPWGLVAIPINSGATR